MATRTIKFRSPSKSHTLTNFWAVRAGHFSAKFHLRKTRLAQKKFQFQFRPHRRIVQNPIRSRGAIDVQHGIGARRLLEILVE
jgi:hypothetical protein